MLKVGDGRCGVIKGSLFLFPIYLIPGIYQLKRLIKVNNLSFTKSCLLITRSSWVAFSGVRKS